MMKMKYCWSVNGPCQKKKGKFINSFPLVSNVLQFPEIKNIYIMKGTLSRTKKSNLKKKRKTQKFSNP